MSMSGSARMSGAIVSDANPGGVDDGRVLGIAGAVFPANHGAKSLRSSISAADERGLLRITALPDGPPLILD